VQTTPNRHIFVVDDQEIISLTAAAILRRAGFEVTAFTDPLECLAAAFSGQPDLLVSDVLMPGLSGIDLAVQVQQVCPNCRILLVSGIVDTNDPMLAEAQKHHFDLLGKPLQPLLFIQEVCGKLAYRNTAA
jgi:CheY-like chemotaxis protein